MHVDVVTGCAATTGLQLAAGPPLPAIATEYFH